MGENVEGVTSSIDAKNDEIENMRVEKDSLMKEIEKIKNVIVEKDKKITELNAYIANHIIGEKKDDEIMYGNFNDIYRKTLKEIGGN